MSDEWHIPPGVVDDWVSSTVNGFPVDINIRLYDGPFGREVFGEIGMGTECRDVIDFGELYEFLRTGASQYPPDLTSCGSMVGRVETFHQLIQVMRETVRRRNELA